MTTAHDFYEATGTLLRKALKNPVLQEALLKAPEAVKQIMVATQRDNSGHVLRVASTDAFGSPAIYCRVPGRETFSKISDMAVSLTGAESLYMTQGAEHLMYGEEKVSYTARDVTLVCASGTTYRVCYYDAKGAYQKQDKETVQSLLMRASTLTCFLFSMWTLRIGNTYPLLPKGSVYGN